MLRYVVCRQSPNYSYWGENKISLYQGVEAEPNHKLIATIITNCMPYGFAVDLLLHNFIASIFTVKGAKCDTKVAQCLLIAIAINTCCMTYTQCKLVFKGFEKARSNQVDTTIGQPIFFVSQRDFEQYRSENRLTTGIYKLDTGKYYQIIAHSHEEPKELTLRSKFKGALDFTDKEIVTHLNLYYRFKEYTETNASQTTSAKHQTQAIIGFFSSVEAGIRWAYSVDVVVNPNISNTLLKIIIAVVAGTGRGGAFFWSSGHAACDTTLGKTFTGNFLYGALTSPLMPDLVKYITVTSPAAMCVIYSSAILQTKEALKIENWALSSLFYTVAVFSGIMGFLSQKGYTCDVMYNNVGKNLNCVDEWNKFWYGDEKNTTPMQKAAYATKRFIDILSALPLATLDITDRLLSICCYFVLAILPIQIIALCQYISYPTLTYWVYYQVFDNTQDLLEAYGVESTPELSAKIKFIATFTLSVLLGEAAGFTMLNVAGRHILKETNMVYNNGESMSIGTTDQTLNTLLTSQEETSQNGFKRRFYGAVAYAKNSFVNCSEWVKKQIYGENGLNSA